MDTNAKAGVASQELQQSESNWYEYGFWDKEMLTDRKKLTSVLVLPLIYTTLLMWVCLSIFWGSLITNNDISKIKVAVANFDSGGSLGSAIVSGIQAANAANPNHLDWQFNVPFQSVDDCKASVLDESFWAVIQSKFFILILSPNATNILETALRTGNSSYASQSAVLIFTASARNQITVNSHVVPPILGVLNPLLAVASIQHTASFLSSLSSSSSALPAALKCPQCVASPFGLTSIDLNPFDSAPATGSIMVGLIFLLTFTFSIFQILRATGLTIGAHLRISSTLVFRTTTSIIAYFFMALSYTLINLAFGVPLDRVYGKAGVVVFWMLNTCTMGAVGLPMESLFTLIGLQWAGYFLSFWIIVNVSGAFTSFELMPNFYQYGYAFPFYHSIQGARTIIFGTKSHLGVNFGVLIAWMVAGLLGMYVGTAWRIRQNAKAGVHQVP